MPGKEMRSTLVEITADIVSAYVSNNPLPADNLSELISSVHSAVIQLSNPAGPEDEKPTPAANPKRSVFPDYIICLEDGTRLKSLRRHLLTHHGLTPEEYRAKWDLPADYPMVSPNYAATRSELAKKMGLGRKSAANGTPLKPSAVNRKAPGKAKPRRKAA
jgi:predicted transcriptional regulator